MGQSIPGATAGAMDQRPFRTRPSAKQPPLLAKKMESGTAPLRAEPPPACAETRTTTSPAIIGHFDALVGLMRDGGFSHDLAHHALHALGSRALGFSQELFDPGDGAAPSDAAVAEMASQFPHLAAMLTEIAHDDPDSTLGWCDDQTEFEFGLDLILNGLDNLRQPL